MSGRARGRLSLAAIAGGWRLDVRKETGKEGMRLRELCRSAASLSISELHILRLQCNLLLQTGSSKKVGTPEMATQGDTFSLSLDYIKSRPGILRILEAVIGLCGVISGSQGAYCHDFGKYNFYNFVVATTLILAIIIIVIFLVGLDKLCTIINFPISFFINDLIFAILYLVAAILMCVAIPTCKPGVTARIFAGIFGFLGTIVVGSLAYYGYQCIRGVSIQSSAVKSDPA